MSVPLFEPSFLGTYLPAAVALGATSGLTLVQRG